MKTARWVGTASFIAGSAILAQAPRAETLTEQEFSTRLVVSLRVAEAKAQKLLPAPWQVSPQASGWNRGANVQLVFSDRMLKLDADGKAGANAAERTLSLNVLAKNPQTGEAANQTVRSFTSNPQGVPGVLRNSVLSTIQHDVASKGSGVSAAAASQSWSVRDAQGATIEFQVEYDSALPVASKTESKNFSGATAYRIFRVEQGQDVIRSAADGVDRARKSTLRVTGGELKELFDGSEQVIAIAAAPWYLRRVFLP